MKDPGYKEIFPDNFADIRIIPKRSFQH